MTTIIQTVTNDETAMSAMIYLSEHRSGGYAISLRDDDSGHSLGVAFHGIQTIEAAVMKARSLVCV